MDIITLICVLLVLADVIGVVNINGWGGKRKNTIGEPLP